MYRVYIFYSQTKAYGCVYISHKYQHDVIEYRVWSAYIELKIQQYLLMLSVHKICTRSALYCLSKPTAGHSI